MGCCFSRPAGPNAPYPGGAPSGSARAINSPRLQAAMNESESTPASARPSQSQPASPRIHRSSQHPLSQHIDKPLRRHPPWTSKRRIWTREELDGERGEFFDTRVTGRQEVWSALKLAVELLWEADHYSKLPTTSEDQADHEHTEAVATAQGILRAAEITLPTGDLANGAYDALGNYYPLPEYIVSDPANIAEPERDATGQKGGGDVTGAEDTSEEPDENEVSRRREEKGKSVINVRDLIKLRARLSETARDCIVSIGPDETVGSVIRKIAEESEPNVPSKKIRIAYMGKILKETASLQAQGWKQGHTVNALVFNR